MKIKYMFAVLLLSVLFLAAAANADSVKIVTTIFPIYDWVREIVGSNADVTLLMDSGIDLHSYQPTAQDIMKISSSDLFIYVGGESDKWVGDVLKTTLNPNLTAINLVNLMGSEIKEEEIVEGMEHEHDHDHEEHDEADHEEHEHEEHTDADHEEHEHEEHADADHEEHEHEEHADADHDDHEEHDHDHEHEGEADEHVWLSLRNAQKLVRVITDTLVQIDADNAALYQANAERYCADLAALDQEYTKAVDSARLKTFLFGDRFPFRYLADDYGLTYYAAFSGCSAESEASFKTIIFLAEKVDTLGLPVVLTIEKPKMRIAETIIENTKNKNQAILAMNSMQGITKNDVDNGVTYLTVMKENLSVLRTALGL